MPMVESGPWPACRIIASGSVIPSGTITYGVGVTVPTPSNPLSAAADSMPALGPMRATIEPTTSAPAITDDGKLDQVELDFIVHAARNRSKASGLTAAQAAWLDGIMFSVDSMSGRHIGAAQSRQVRVDTDGAGYGWFIDPTPLSDEEFSIASPNWPDSSALGRIDLLTVILHELGHHLGGEDLDVETYPDHFLADRLSPGQRRLPKPEDLDLLFANPNLLGSVFE